MLSKMLDRLYISQFSVQFVIDFRPSVQQQISQVSVKFIMLSMLLDRLYNTEQSGLRQVCHVFCLFVCCFVVVVFYTVLSLSENLGHLTMLSKMLDRLYVKQFSVQVVIIIVKDVVPSVRHQTVLCQIRHVVKGVGPSVQHSQVSLELIMLSKMLDRLYDNQTVLVMLSKSKMLGRLKQEKSI